MYVRLSVCPSVYASLSVSVCLSVCLYVCTSVYMNACLSLYVRISIRVCLCDCSSVYLSVRLCMHLHDYLYPCLCPADGNWNSWTPWGQCSVTCGSGTVQRSRTCSNPPPNYCGQTCPGPPNDARPCDTMRDCCGKTLGSNRRCLEITMSSL